MKLVGSYTSPFVRKLSILLLEKGKTFAAKQVFDQFD
jgi:glutathione S-transferase